MLYDILQPHLPDDEDIDSLEFIGKILESMKQMPEDYDRALHLMTGFSIIEMIDNGMSSEEVLNEFYLGLADNQIAELKRFCESLYG